MKAILFDLDCTLHDRKSSISSFVEAQYKQLLSFDSSLPPRYIQRFHQLEKNGYIWKDKVYHSLQEEFRLPLSPSELLTEYITFFHSHCSETPYATEVLTSLRQSGYLLGLITNGKTTFQHATINALQLAPYFDVILISEEVGLKKPDPAIFSLALERLQIPATEAVYIGDSIENDVLAPQLISMKSILFAPLNTSPQNTYPVITCLRELTERFQ
ncbi:HAD family hydrolase [Bacillus sp. 2205SS5-2]|uniref:HAD family hydrolase n=1 Tax=Bacillus sp. 2205SS5-2 TaxID=3109031 RepID=UPI003004BA87